VSSTQTATLKQFQKHVSTRYMHVIGARSQCRRAGSFLKLEKPGFSDDLMNLMKSYLII